MAHYQNVIIGIQARSTSKRYPRKVFETIAGKPMINHVIDACNRTALYLNRFTHTTKTMVSIALLVPEGDELASVFKKHYIVVEGSEDDVLSRYALASKKLGADYMVRVTGDCPMIPAYLITKHIKTAIMNNFDYLSNVDPDFRLSADGTDCEVMSARMLEHLHLTAKPGPEREHVTLLARSNPPDWAKIGHVIGYKDESTLKISVDTPEDLERVRWQYDRIQSAVERAEKKHGKGSVHRF